MLLPATILKINSGMLLGNINIVEGYREDRVFPIRSSTTTCKAKKNKRQVTPSFTWYVLVHNQNNE